MTRRLEPGRIVIASHNPGKVREIAALLAPHGIQVVSAAELGLPEPDETEDSFIGNAELKARAAAIGAKLPALADDSGLVVDALDGAPGIFSARWAGPDKDFGVAMRKVQKAIVEQGTDTPRTAHFACALSLAWPDGHCESFEGHVAGSLIWPPRGDQGFGYDPMFVPQGHDLSFGEIEPERKHAMSHRAHAFAKLIAAVF